MIARALSDLAALVVAELLRALRKAAVVRGKTLLGLERLFVRGATDIHADLTLADALLQALIQQRGLRGLTCLIARCEQQRHGSHQSELDRARTLHGDVLTIRVSCRRR